MPYLVRWPGELLQAVRYQLITADTLATCAGLLNTKIPFQAGRDSFDLSSVMLGKEIENPEPKLFYRQTWNLAFRQGN